MHDRTPISSLTAWDGDEIAQFIRKLKMIKKMHASELGYYRVAVRKVPRLGGYFSLFEECAQLWKHDPARDPAGNATPGKPSL